MPLRPRKPSTVGRSGKRNEIGARGEALAADFLLQQGYEILARNWQGWWGEVDILARNGEEVVAVEVKARTGRTGEMDVGGIYRLPKAKRQKLSAMLAGAYPESFIRFDLLVVRMGEPPTFEWTPVL